jgi:hypothetical protein
MRFAGMALLKIKVSLFDLRVGRRIGVANLWMEGRGVDDARRSVFFALGIAWG